MPTRDGKLTFERAVEQWLAAHVSPTTGRPYSENTKDVIRFNLLGGRCTAWREAKGIYTVDSWTATRAAEYLSWYQHEMGADSATIKKVRSELRQFAEFCAATFKNKGATGPALDTMRVSSASDPPEAKEDALTQGEATFLIEKAPTDRDRLLVAMLLYTGMRPSELLALDERNVRLDRKPPIVEVRGSVHHRARTKSEAGYRDIPLTIGQNMLPRLMQRHLTAPGRPQASSRLFLSSHSDTFGNAVPFSLTGLNKVLQKLGVATGIHCNPYRFRHTFCTWCADAGMHMLHLQQLLGHSSSAMVAYYYRGRTSEAVLAAAAQIRF